MIRTRLPFQYTLFLDAYSKLDDILDQVDEKAYTTAYLDFFPKTFQFDNDKFDEFENCTDG